MAVSDIGWAADWLLPYRLGERVSFGQYLWSKIIQPAWTVSAVASIANSIMATWPFAVILSSSSP